MIQIDHVTFSYGEETEHTGGVRDIELQIKRGEFAVLCGESGCGKTTITRLINGLIPHYYEGKMSGGVWVNGAEVSKQPLYDTAKIVGSVFQNPRSQFFNVDTTSEITFGCENLGQPAETIRARLERTVCDFRLEKLMDRNIFHLSGGEKQKVACAGVSIMEPEVLVLDEPSSNLDAASISDLRKTLAFWKSQGKTIIVPYGCGRPFKGLCLFYGKRRLKCGQLLCAPVLQRGHAELLLEYRCKLSLIGIANLLRDFCNGAAGVR